MKRRSNFVASTTNSPRRRTNAVCLKYSTLMAFRRLCSKQRMRLRMTCRLSHSRRSNLLQKFNTREVTKPQRRLGCLINTVTLLSGFHSTNFNKKIRLARMRGIQQCLNFLKGISSHIQLVSVMKTTSLALAYSRQITNKLLD